MVYLIFICIVSIFTALGIFTCISEIKKFTYKKIPLNITVHTRDLKNETEYFIRSLYARYPDSRVTVIDDSGEEEVLAALSRGYPSLTVRSETPSQSVPSDE